MGSGDATTQRVYRGNVYSSISVLTTIVLPCVLAAVYPLPPFLLTPDSEDMHIYAGMGATTPERAKIAYGTSPNGEEDAWSLR